MWWGGSAVPVLVSSMSMFILLMHCINYAVNSNSRQKQNNSQNHQPIRACRDWPFVVTRRPGRTSPRVAVSFVITTWNYLPWFSGKFLWPWKRPRKCTYIQNEMMRWTMKILSSHYLTKIIEGVKSEENQHYSYSYSIFFGRNFWYFQAGTVPYQWLDCKGAKQERFFKVNKSREDRPDPFSLSQWKN